MSVHLDIGDTLAQVNVVRTAFGMPSLHELPHAHMGDPAACLFYRALADCGARSVHGDSISFSTERQASLVAELWGVRANGNKVASPRQVRRTISRFDDHQFPHYDMPGDRNPTHEEDDSDEDEYYEDEE